MRVDIDFNPTYSWYIKHKELWKPETCLYMDRHQKSCIFQHKKGRKFLFYKTFISPFIIIFKVLRWSYIQMYLFDLECLSCDRDLFLYLSFDLDLFLSLLYDLLLSLLYELDLRLSLLNDLEYRLLLLNDLDLLLSLLIDLNLLSLLNDLDLLWYLSLDLDLEYLPLDLDLLPKFGDLDLLE